MKLEYWIYALKGHIVNPITLHAGGGFFDTPVFTARVDPLGVKFDPRYFLTFNFYVLRRV